MILSVASGKGGTGKTTIATSLALSLKNAQILDCDVEEPNAHIFIQPEIENSETISLPVPEIDESLCDHCGRCQEVCAYHAIAVLPQKVLVFPQLCHGCGSCHYFCPRKAIKEVDQRIGVVETGFKDDLAFAHGRLDIGQAMAPPLIRALQKHVDPQKINIIDAPPGTSCPVIEAIRESDFCILVTEPTPFGLNDLRLAVEVLRKLKIPFGVVINRSDLGDSCTEDYCRKESMPVLMRVPFDRAIAEGYSRGQTLVETNSEYKDQFNDIYFQINKLIKQS